MPRLLAPLSVPEPSIGDPPASIRFNRLGVGIVLLGLLVILAFSGSSAYDAWRSYGYSVDAAEREIGNEANALAEQTAWTLQAVDLLLLDTARWYRSESRGIPPERVDAALAIRTAGLQQVRQVVIIDAQGNQLYRSRAISTPNLNISDRSYFRAQRDNAGVGLFMSEPLVTRSEGRPAVVLSRRLEDEHGNFAGIVTATVDLRDLNRFYRAADLGMAGAIQLLRDDGTLLVRNPPAPDLVGKAFPALAFPRTTPGAVLANPIDGTKDFIAVAPVRATRLEVAVTREVAAALRPWRSETIRVGMRTLIIAMIGALTIAALLRQIRRVADGEKALRESEQRYALAMEGANEGHWDWDIASDRLFLSPKMKMLGGQSPEADIDSRAAWAAKIVMHPDDVAQFEANLRDHLEGRTARFECEYRVRHADGRWCWLLSRGRCLRDSNGQPKRFVGSAMDVTAQKQAQLDKEQLEAQLRQSQKMEAIGTLAGGIAHDFNNILGAILGYGELALQESDESSALRRYLDNVMHATERAKLLVERILGFSRSGLGDREPVNVQSVVVETLELLEASLPPGIRLEKRLEVGNAAVIGDATYLHQVVMNLCTNSIHAMGAGGVLSVRLERTGLLEPRTLSRGSLAPGSYVTLSVGDTGAGIPSAVLDRVFDPFFTTKETGEGTGLGLSLVHGIVTDLGGAIDVATSVGHGTKFDIWLPVAGEVAARAAEADRALARGNGEIIMIVDDERPLVDLAEETIANLGYEPVGFDSSRAALEAFRAAPNRFDAVLTDEAMPELTGTAFAQELRRLRPAIPIIVMTGFDGGTLRERAADIGVNEVLRKPVRRHDLADSLARVLDTRPVGDTRAVGDPSPLDS
jgi:PAS domain S-box-containing protein